MSLDKHSTCPYFPQVLQSTLTVLKKVCVLGAGVNIYLVFNVTRNFPGTLHINSHSSMNYEWLYTFWKRFTKWLSNMCTGEDSFIPYFSSPLPISGCSVLLCFAHSPPQPLAPTCLFHLTFLHFLQHPIQ